MTYFDHRREPPPYQPAFARTRQHAAYQVDEDGDRIYTEDDYAVEPDGDAFLPDETEEEPSYDAGAHPFSYAGTYDTMSAVEEDRWEPFRDDQLTEEFLTEEELQELRRSNWRLLAGLADFAAVIVGTAAILLLITLLVSLLNWLVSDVSQTFTLLQTHI